MPLTLIKQYNLAFLIIAQNKETRLNVWGLSREYITFLSIAITDDKSWFSTQSALIRASGRLRIITRYFTMNVWSMCCDWNPTSSEVRWEIRLMSLECIETKSSATSSFVIPPSWVPGRRCSLASMSEQVLSKRRNNNKHNLIF